MDMLISVYNLEMHSATFCVDIISISGLAASHEHPPASNLEQSWIVLKYGDRTGAF